MKATVKELAGIAGRATLGALDLCQSAVLQAALAGGRLSVDVARRVPTLLPKDLDARYRSALDEIRADLEGLPAEALRVDVAALVSSWGKVLGGAASPADRRAVDGLLRAFQVKALHGAERFTAPGAFPVAPTPRTLVHRSGTLELYRYRRPGEPVTPKGAPPVLIVYSIINRSYVLDLMEGYSFVRQLLDDGLDVWIVEWGAATRGDRETTLDRWLLTDLPSCLDAIEKVTGAPRVSLLGHCMGGVFASAFAALSPDRIDRLLTLTTPFTVAEGGLVSLLTDPRLFPVDALVDGFGLMPGKLIRLTFLLLKPWYEAMRWRAFLDNVANDRGLDLFFAADTWVNDNPDLHGEVFRAFVKTVYFEDRLRNRAMRAGERTVDLGNVTCPVLNVAAQKDWVVPPRSAAVAAEAFRSHDYRYLEVEGFHVSLFFDPRLRGRWAELAAFLHETRSDQVPKKRPKAKRKTAPARPVRRAAG